MGQEICPSIAKLPTILKIFSFVLTRKFGLWEKISSLLRKGGIL
jgi:hypothetical protein